MLLPILSLVIFIAPTLTLGLKRQVLIHSDLSSPAPSCLRESFYGSYGGSKDQQHIFLTDVECVQEFFSSDSDALITVSSRDSVELDEDQSRLIWIGQAGLDEGIHESVKMDMREAWTYISSRSESWNTNFKADFTLQMTFDAPGFLGWREIKLVSLSRDYMLLQVPIHILPILDTLLPAHLVPVALPTEPRELLPEGWEPVPRHYIDHLVNVTSHIRFDPALDEILSSLDSNSIRRNIRYLTGEGPSGIESRHAFTQGARKAAAWIKEKAEETGAECHCQQFLPGFSPNVICTYPHSAPSKDGKVILSAHYDSRGSFGSTRAPGGDDDGSGTGHLLEVALAIGREKIKFHHEVVLAWFSGEEQGLFGSAHYAKELKKANETVILQVQADMIGYHVPGEPLQLALPESIGTFEAGYLLSNLSQIYAPELVVGITPGCCSDHQSFFAIGYPSTAVFERNGPIADPMYHNSGDLTSREGYDFEQITSIAKVTMASILTVAGWSSKK